MKVCIIGAGNVGFQKAYDVLVSTYKHEVCFVNPYPVSKEKIERLVSAVNDELFHQRRKIAATQVSQCRSIKDTTADVYWICIPSTPSADGPTDAMPFETIVEDLKLTHGTGDYLLINSSTTNIGFNAALAKYAFKQPKQKYAYIPERLNTNYDYHQNHQLKKYIGLHTNTMNRIKSFIEMIYPENTRYVTLQEAELIKLADILYRAVNVSFLDEMSMLAHTSKDPVRTVECIREVMAAHFNPKQPTSGGLPYPGTGVGGECIRNAFYFFHRHQRAHSLIGEAKEISELKQNFIIERIIAKFIEMEVVADTKIEIYGATFKANATSLAGSTAKAIILRLAYMSRVFYKHNKCVDLSNHIHVFDPVNQDTPPDAIRGLFKRYYPNQLELKSPRTLRVLLVDHDVFDIGKHRKTFDLIFAGKYSLP